MEFVETCTVCHQLEHDPNVAKQWMVPTDLMNDNDIIQHLVSSKKAATSDYC